MLCWWCSGLCGMRAQTTPLTQTLGQRAIPQAVRRADEGRRSQQVGAPLARYWYTTLHTQNPRGGSGARDWQISFSTKPGSEQVATAERSTSHIVYTKLYSYNPGGDGNPLQGAQLGNPRGTEEPGGLQSRGPQRVWHDWATKQRWTPPPGFGKFVRCL